MRCCPPCSYEQIGMDAATGAEWHRCRLCQHVVIIEVEDPEMGGSPLTDDPNCTCATCKPPRKTAWQRLMLDELN